jgi:hypothetical protein
MVHCLFSELQSALEALRVETDKQAGGRLKLASEIRKDVEVCVVRYARNSVLNICLSRCQYRRWLQR